MPVTLFGIPMKYDTGILVVSDRAAAGERPDACLAVFRRLLAQSSFDIVSEEIVPDEAAIIEDRLRELVRRGVALILTSGGTGCGPRDITPEVTRKLLDKPTPGLDEAIRAESRPHAPFAIFSRAVSGVAGRSFIVNLPGSPRAVAQILEYLLPILEHPVKLVRGEVTDCAEETGLDARS